MAATSKTKTKSNRKSQTPIFVRIFPPGRMEFEFLLRAIRGLLATPAADKEKPYREFSSSFAGVCIAAPKDMDALERAVDLVKGLKLRSLRMDLSAEHDLRMVDLILDRVREIGCEVLLHLVQSQDEASRMTTDEGIADWRTFLNATLDHFKGRVEAVEVGTTVNRAKWAGYSLEGFLNMWDIAHTAINASDLALAGPNITDFEPQYNAGLLGMMRVRGLLPHIQSNNLFAERAIEPELSDRKILGERLKGLHGFDLVKKAHFIQSIGELNGVPRAWSTSAFWTLPRIKRVLTNSEEKMADYLVRYFILCAASGAFERIYWGPLVSRREGLLDDGTGVWSQEGQRDIVSYYCELPGESAKWCYRPAYYALETLNRLLVGARYKGILTHGPELQIHAFEHRERVIHVCWTMNGKVALAADCYQEQNLMGISAAYGRDGSRMDKAPSCFGESPCYLEWPVGQAPTVRGQAAVLPRVVVAPVYKGKGYYGYDEGEWRGLVYSASYEEAALLIDALRPQSIAASPQQSSLRKARNAIWTVSDPRTSNRSLVVVKKPVRIAWHKRLFDRKRPSKALRSWNGSCELLRRGIDSPRPLAFFEAKDPKQMLENWFVCEHFEGEHSVRSFFTQYAKGEVEVEGVLFKDFVHRLVNFIRKMHKRGVYFRDLSGGNVLVQVEEGGRLKFSVIDTARARFRNKVFPLSRRIDDLKRLVHKLDPERQKYFMNVYLKKEGSSFTTAQKISFKLFALKAQLKRWKRRLRKRFLSGKKCLVALFLNLPSFAQHILYDLFAFPSAG
ncbi:MAG: lipopolysaccharide kinase InaA family protein [Opitutales bacterium]